MNSFVTASQSETVTAYEVNNSIGFGSSDGICENGFGGEYAKLGGLWEKKIMSH